ncbi:MFS transporter [Pontibacillus marinus]|uniref:Major facilitator superfamily (MFS) profile domain-containing protein n=1 Tax=Pontibacillus marinus BH030004 = DSM 16465 TaxID=1385511 RepID=A0A0A5GGM5_9BACI|nr:MFS transporter [Pontibacillus marinus]KGX90270.1 hypothetical protein N783_21000 [Pontibacillus marinus BH030004 = DSM 16465]
MSLTKRNINMIYLYVFIAQLAFDRALWVIYLSDSGLSMGQIGIIEAIMHLSVVLFEVPTGMISDLYGRKVSILLGNVTMLGYSGFMLYSDSLSLFGLAFMSLGLGMTFRSGAEEALAYDTLKQENREKDYTRIFGNMTALSLLSLSMAKLLGGWMADISWEWVYGSMIAVHVITFIPIALLKEPEREQPKQKHMKFMEQWRNQFKQGFFIWKENPTIHMPIILFLAATTTIVILTFYGQEYFTRLGFSSLMIGVIFTVDGLLGVAMAKLAHRLEQKWEFFNVVNYGYGLYILFFVLFIVSPEWGIVVAFLILSQLITLFEPIFSNFIQNLLSSDVRSTFFSMISLVESFVIMIGFPLFGYMIGTIGFQNGFFILLIVLLVIYSLSFMNRFKNKQL